MYGNRSQSFSTMGFNIAVFLFASFAGYWLGSVLQPLVSLARFEV